MENNTLEIGGVTAPVIILGLVEIAKQIGLSSKLAPILSVLLGIILGLIAYFLQIVPSFSKAIILGFMEGLVSSGLYSGVKKVALS